MATSTKRRPCAKCGRNRAEKFFVSARGRVCLTCQRKRTKFASREQRLMETYGITLDEYDALLAYNDGKCWVCNTKRPYNLDVDHDHGLERNLVDQGIDPLEAARLSIRGLGCKQCNRRLLPSVQDSIDRLEMAIDYLLDAYGTTQRILREMAHT